MAQKPEYYIIGAGPAGLTAAFELARQGVEPWVFEASDAIGGIARTVIWGKDRIDIGGHRFYTKSPEVRALWREMGDEPMLTVRRISRIYHEGKFFDYPLRMSNVLGNFGPVECLRILGSWMAAHLWPEQPENSLKVWIINRFGQRLYEKFFRSYTEKVWGIPCEEIGADWAAQRIGGVNFLSVVWQALSGRSAAKSLIQHFEYPRLGPGMLWESCARKIVSQGGHVKTRYRVQTIRHDAKQITAIEIIDPAENRHVFRNIQSLISSMPLSALASSLAPAPPEPVLRAARSLRYRDFLIVALRCRRRELFPDQWLYIHEPSVRVGRIQNFNNWSPDLVAAETGTLLGLEYFTSTHEDLWQMRDAELVALAKREVEFLGLVASSELEQEGLVLRQPKAYPLYDADYRNHLAVLREYFSSFTNLQSIGRNGLHRYNNQDHSMLAGLAAARRALGLPSPTPWDVCPDSSFLESIEASTEKSA